MDFSVDRPEIIRTLFITVVAEIISFGVLIPIVPLLLTEPSSSFFILPESLTVNDGFILLGVLIGLYPLGQLISTPILGELSDVYGRKTIIQLSILGTVVSSIVFGIGIIYGSLAVLFLSRLLNGLTGGLISVVQATIADVTEKKDKSKNFGIIGAAFGIGFILGPFFGGVLSSDLHPFFTANTPFFFTAGISALSMIYVRIKLEETSPMANKKVEWMKPFKQLKKGIQLPGLRKLFAANFFYFSGFAFFTTFIPVYLVKQFGFNQFQNGIFFLYLGTLVMLGQGLLVPKVYSRFAEEKVMPLALFLTGLFIILQPLSGSLAVFTVLVTLFSFSNALARIALNTLVSNNSSDKDQGLALGTNQGLRSLGNAIPSMLSGIAAAAFTPTAPLVIAGLIIVFTAVSYWLTE